MTGLCLWSGTLAGHDVWTRIRAAGRAGFASLSVAPNELATVVADGDEGRLDAELDTYALRLACLDPVVAWLPDPVPAHPAHRVYASVGAAQCLDLAERFGIRLVNVIDVTWRRLPSTASPCLAEFAARAARRGIGVVVEAQVYSAIPNLATALDLCRGTGPNVSLMVDAWHFFRDGTNRIADLAGLPVGALQVSDGPAWCGGDLVAESSTGRLMPGRGGFDLTRLAAAIPPGCLVGPEVFTSRVPVARTYDVAMTALTTTRDVLLAAAGRRSRPAAPELDRAGLRPR